jgi:hypothetical protein
VQKAEANAQAARKALHNNFFIILALTNGNVNEL